MLRKPVAYFATTLVSSFLLALSSASGQAPAQLKAQLEARIKAQAAAAAAGAKSSSSTTKPSTSSSTPKNALLDKVKKAEFDRRPSAIFDLQKYLALKKAGKIKPPKAKDSDKDKEEEEKPKDKEPEKELTDEEKEKAEAAAKKKAEAEEKKAKAAAAAKKADDDVKELKQVVTLGQWKNLGAKIESSFEKEDDRKAAYTAILTSLRKTPTKAYVPIRIDADAKPVVSASSASSAGVSSTSSKFKEAHSFLPQDIVGLADASPVVIDGTLASGLASLLKTTLSQGSVPDFVIESMQTGTRRLGGEELENRLAAARVLLAAGLIEEAGEFLPDREVALNGKGWAALDLLSEHLISLHSKEGESELLEEAWQASQDILGADEDAPEELRTSAMIRCLELAPRIDEEISSKWFDESFKASPEQGLAILSKLGSMVSGSRALRDPNVRFRHLNLQSRAVEALLKTSPKRAEEWSGILTIMAGSWLREADYTRIRGTSTSRGPMMNYDSYGNVYFSRSPSYSSTSSNSRDPLPIGTDDIIDAAPSGAWQKHIAPEVLPQVHVVSAQLNLKVSEIDPAFDAIQKLAPNRPEKALELCDELIGSWATKNDPNASRRRTNPYMYSYGYNPRAGSIPLTRSKQERNLSELGDLVKRINELEIGNLEEKTLVSAFTKIHSKAEVFKLSRIQQIFGDTKDLDEKTISVMAQTMRGNLLGVWRDPKVQETAKTKRTDEDIIAEVNRGYNSAIDLVDEAIENHPESWRLYLAKGSLTLDQATFQNSLEKDSSYSGVRDDCYATLAKAAEFYGKQVEDMPANEQTGIVFDTWFYSGLGASDLGAVRHEQVADPRQPALIRAAIEALPGEAAEDHLRRFANNLSVRMSNVKPDVKHRYLKAGLEIVGDHERSKDARDLFDYYADLITEVRFVARIDGTDRVGHDEPFGMFVEIRHTKEIEREAGGFGRYLQNQNNQSYGFNYGRPTENYRDKFEEAATEILEESFEIQSVTFHDPKIKSRGAGEEGWRVTPYAYIMLRPKGPEVDTIPALTLNLDFLDISGYAVIPIGTSALSIDSTDPVGDLRPVDGLEVSQILDERNASEDELGLEIRATGKGVIPPLESFLDLMPDQFDVVSIEDDGSQVVELNTEEDVVPVSERTWTAVLKAKPELKDSPTSFQFAALRADAPVGDSPKVLYQRYDDADLADAEQNMRLTETYEPEKSPWPMIIGLAVLILGALAIWLFVIPRLPKSEPAHAAARHAMPEELNSFTVLALLRRIQNDPDLDDSGRGELDAEIEQLESRHYAIDAADEADDLKETAQRWIQRAA